MRFILRSAGASRAQSDVRIEADTTTRLGGRVVMALPTGTLVELDDKAAARLQDAGLDLVPLPNAASLRYGTASVDIASGLAAAEPTLTVPADRAADWPIHLLHLVAPLEPGWNDALVQQGVQVLDVVSGQGLLVRGAPAAAQGTLALGFVDWAGPLQPEWKIEGGLREAASGPVNVVVDASEDLDAVRARLEARGGRILRVDRGESGDPHRLRVELDPAGIEAAANEPGVVWIEASPNRAHCGEREAQILAENLDASQTQPVVGYQAWLTGLTFDGTNETIAICDTGVDRNAANNTQGHQDIRGRMAAFVDYSGGADANDLDGHGSHVCGIAVGNGATGATEGAAPGNFLRGLGVAPGAQFVALNYLTTNTTWPADSTLAQDAVANGATAINNSWAAPPQRSYTTDSIAWDKAVRDANATAAGWQPLIPIFAAANFGGMPGSIGAPQEGKNIIVVGNGLNWRVGFGFGTDQINGLSPSSSRGPAGDGRLLPTVIAPGTDVSSIWSRFGDTGSYTPIAGTGTAQVDGTLVDAYLNIGGTSMAAPHVTGAVALISEWWKARTGGKAPSAALVKALLVNSAEDLAGGANWHDTTRWATERALWTSLGSNRYSRTLNGLVPTTVLRSSTTMTNVAALTAADQWMYNAGTNTLSVQLAAGQNPTTTDVNGNPTVYIRFLDSVNIQPIPNNDQGWGRVSLENLFFQTPTSDRGPRLYLDQTAAFDTVGQRHAWTIAPIDPTRPMRVTMAYSDAPAAASANPALVNNLNLEVQRVGTATIWRGNNFANGFSTPGGAADTLNNLECVYIQTPTAGSYEVRVTASVLQKDARPPYSTATPWQDFALVIENAAFVSAAPVAVASVIDRSGSMMSYGYVDVTRLAARQFVDLMQVNDRIGVVSFGDTGTVEMSDGANPRLINGDADRELARTAIANINFGGCTYMGDGIQKAKDLLAGTAGRRAIVMLSDGYDNKGCDETNPAKPSAAEAAATLPSGVGIYACAMGPYSDQDLLHALATSTGGRYYYMPTIDDLLEIYNFIRGNVTGDSLSVNASGLASKSAVSAVVDACSEQATFVVSWTVPGLRVVDGEPRKSNEISVRLRDPGGRLLPARASWVERLNGDGYAIFRVEAPAPGTWKMEVSTARDEHTRYQAACFLRSAIRLDTRFASTIKAGSALSIVTGAWRGEELITQAKTSLRVSRPSVAVPDLAIRFADQLKGMKARLGEPLAGGDVGKLAMLDAKLRAAGNGPLMTMDTDVAVMSLDTATEVSSIRSISRFPLRFDDLRRVLRPRVPGFTTKVPTAVVGSYNVIVEMVGSDPHCGSRFVRTDLVSVRVT